MFMQTRFDASQWLPKPGESPLDYWASLSPMAPLFGVSWRFAEPEYIEELEAPEPVESARIDATADDAEIVPEEPVENDLTEIKGVGPKMAARLAEAGVTTYSQIAAWSTETVAQMNEQLGCLPGMIERAEWVRQAQDLAAYEAKRA